MIIWYDCILFEICLYGMIVWYEPASGYDHVVWLYISRGYLYGMIVSLYKHITGIIDAVTSECIKKFASPTTMYYVSEG